MQDVPEELLIEDEKPPTPGPQIPPKPPAAKPTEPGKLSHLKWWIKTHKPIAIIIALLLIAGASGGVYAILKPEAKTTKVAVAPKKKDEPAPPTTVASPLTGLQIAPELATRPVTGMMIENSPEARPQSGLAQAGVVFEATAEGGITRFLALYQDARPANIGPVRSLRPYYIDWALPFQAAVGHVGGSPEALAQAKATGLRDLDQFANSGAYQRTSDRYAPHNVYTNADKIDALQKSKGYTTSTYTPWPRKADKADYKAAKPTVKKISYDISSYLFHDDYTYDQGTNSYLRTLAGLPHKDRESGAQLSSKVLIVLKMAHRLVDRQHYGITTTGSGPASIFQDGGVVEGTWNKADRTSMFSFKDKNGAVIPLNAGQTWIAIIPSDHSITTSAQ